MDVVIRMLDHHLWLVGEIVDRTASVTDEVLDRPIELSVEGIDEAPTLRSLSDRLVGQLEMWVDAVAGATQMPPEGDRTAVGLRARLDVVGPRFRSLVVPPLQEGRADETFIDAVCEPPRPSPTAGWSPTSSPSPPSAAPSPSAHSSPPASPTSAPVTPCASSEAQAPTPQPSSAPHRKPDRTGPSR
ncbi:MAG TPA: hypothetical protein VEV13_02085 [Candidatus Limnocylindria bacterium]|nr:hypothetical protein [Candidatus Limnocylindria bacterium]